MPDKKSGGTGYEQPKRSDQGQGGFDKGMEKEIGTDRDVNAPKHGTGKVGPEDERGSAEDVSRKPELPRE